MMDGVTIPLKHHKNVVIVSLKSMIQRIRKFNEIYTSNTRNF